MHNLNSIRPGIVPSICRLLGLWLLVSLMSGCAVDYAAFKQQRMAFQSGNNKLLGTLVTPRETAGPVPVLIFVHGDGELNFDAFGYYRPFWEQLAARGIGAFVWDKPGVGGSTGNWLDQTMEDRAAEVNDAIQFLQSQQEHPISRIGLIGFSQAGWVMPRINADELGLCCMIFVSTAVDWQDQGDYLTRQRLLNEGLAKEEINRYLQEKEKLNRQLFKSTATYDDYEEWYTRSESDALKSGKLTPERFRFVQQNWKANATKGLKDLKVPILVLFGEDDLNVDAKTNARRYRELFASSGHSDYTVEIFADATHGLTSSDYLNRQLPGFTEVAMIHLMGEKWFASGALQLIAEWAAGKFQMSDQRTSRATNAD